MTEKYILVRQDEIGSQKSSRDSVSYLPPPKGVENDPVSLKPGSQRESKAALCAVTDDSKEQKLFKRGLGEMQGDLRSASAGLMRSAPSRLSASLPPVMNISQIVRGRYRFTSLSNTLVSVSIADVLGALGGFCTVANSTFKPWASSFRIKEIRMYPGVNPSVGVSYNSVAWNSGISGVAQDQERVDDLPSGITVTHALSFKPPVRSLTADWISCIATTTTNLFAIQSQNGTLVELYVDYTLSNQFQAGAITISSGTLGSIYYLPLDGAASAEYPSTHLPSTH